MRLEKERWKEELETYRSIQKMFILEGNVNDLQILNVGASSGELVTLEEYLYLYLQNQGYHSVVFYNRIDGFYNYFDESGKMMKLFCDMSAMKNGGKKPDIQTAMNAIRSAVNGTDHSVAVVIQMAGQLLGSAEHLDTEEIEFLSTLSMAATEAGSGSADNREGWANNLILMLTNKVQELPAWFYRYSPYCKVLTLDYPREKLREQIIWSHQEDFIDWDTMEPGSRSKILKQLIARTDGFTCVELDSVLSLCRGVRLQNAVEKVAAYRHGRKENPWEELTPEIIQNLAGNLSKDVLGQPRAVQAAADVITRAATGMAGLQHSSDNRPRGILLFAGPTGTGKTELAKSLARNVFGAESALIRFDMSEYSQGHSDQRLLGAPPGYVGYDAGGELTNAVRAHPFSILLFDEIEKANPGILDKFLQILDDGRMTDSKGETVYFTESVIIFTTNLGVTKTMPDGSRVQLVDSSSSIEELQQTIVQELHRSWRPEFLNRIGNNIIVFDFIHEAQAKMILDKQLSKICSNLEAQRKIRIRISEESPLYRALLASCCSNLEFGGRGVGNTVEHDFITPLSLALSGGELVSGDTVELLDLEPSDYQKKLVFRKLGTVQAENSGS